MDRGQWTEDSGQRTVDSGLVTDRDEGAGRRVENGAWEEDTYYTPYTPYTP